MNWFFMSAMQSMVSVEDASQIGEARRQAATIAAEIGLNESDCGRLAIVVTELATNLQRYGDNGTILIRADASHGPTFVEVISIDRGPGIASVERSLADGYSTGGTPGNGLGAIQRLSSQFDIFSSVPSGTVIFCRVDDSTVPAAAESCFTWSAINLPAPHETVSGDTWCLSQRQDELSIMIVDGLGHGPDAAKVAIEAAELFDRGPFDPLDRMFENLHVRLRSTRGGAIAAAQINSAAAQMKFVGVGNIAGSLKSIGSDKVNRGLFSHNGAVGIQIRRIQEFEYDCPADSLLIMHSDGLQTRWSLDDYPGLINRHPAIIAAILYRDYCRGRDDSTVVVIRHSPVRTRC